MVTMLAGVVFIAQLICCICFHDRVKKYLPTLIAAGFITVTMLSANLGELDPKRLVGQTVVSLTGLSAIILYHSACAVRSMIAQKSDPAQKLKK